jgi:hypothetical protein
MSRYSDRLSRAADRDYAGFTGAVVHKYGLSPGNLSTVLRLATTLHSNDNAKLSSADIEQLQQAYRGVARPDEVAHYAQLVNNAPAAQRADLFCAAMVGDHEVMAGNYVGQGDAYRHARGLMEAAATLDYADTINAKRGGSADASPAWSPEPGSTRALIEAAMEGPERRDFRERLENDDPAALAQSQELLAAGIEQSSRWLERGEGSLHDAVSAAYDVEQGAQLAESEFGIGGNE